MLSGDKRIFNAVFPGQEFMEDVHKLFISGLPGMIFRQCNGSKEISLDPKLSIDAARPGA